MDKLVETKKERIWNPEAFARDQWIRGEAERMKPGSLVLDAGAGASKYRPFFQHCCYRTQDFCRYEGELVKYIEPIDYVCEITAIPVETGSFDAIVSTEVLEHVTDPMAVLDEFARILKPGGRLLVSAPMISNIHMAPYHFYGGFTPYWYEHWLPRHGFGIESITPVGGPGRSCAVFCQILYAAWSAKEKDLSGLLRLLSMSMRMWAKVGVHYVLLPVLPKFDSWLGNETVCSGYLVTAVRKADGKY